MGRKKEVKAPMHPLAIEWHMKRRQRLQGRMSDKEWLVWATKYVAALEDTPWRDWCQQQVWKFRVEMDYRG
jgi:hypothetical protein